jgi:hypothetical protein
MAAMLQSPRTSTDTRELAQSAGTPPAVMIPKDLFVPVRPSSDREQATQVQPVEAASARR